MHTSPPQQFSGETSQVEMRETAIFGKIVSDEGGGTYHELPLFLFVLVGWGHDDRTR